MALTEPVTVACPYCGEPIEIEIDASAGYQDLVEDCAVCCRPIRLAVAVGPDGAPAVDARREDE